MNLRKAAALARCSPLAIAQDQMTRAMQTWLTRKHIKTDKSLEAHLNRMGPKASAATLKLMAG